MPSAGRDEYARTPLARARTAGIRLAPESTATAFSAEGIPIRLILRRSVLPGGPPDLDVTPALLSLSYGSEGISEEGPEGGRLTDLVASATLSREKLTGGRSLPIGNGQRLAFAVRYRERWYDEFEMTLTLGEEATETDDLAVELRDPFSAVRFARQPFLFRETKARPKGWLPHVALRYAAGVLGVPLGRVAKGVTYMTTNRKELGDSLNPPDIVQVALALYEKETAATGREFILRMRRGRLEVVPGRTLRTGPFPRPAYVLGPEVETFRVTTTWRGQSGDDEAALPRFTVVRAQGTIGRGKKERERTVVVTASRTILNRFGVQRTFRDLGRVDNLAELRDRAKRILAKELLMERTATCTLPWVPFLRRGDPVLCPDVNFGNRDNIAFVSSVRHQIDGSGRVTELELTERDLFLELQDELEMRQRALRRRARA